MVDALIKVTESFEELETPILLLLSLVRTHRLLSSTSCRWKSRRRRFHANIVKRSKVPYVKRSRGRSEFSQPYADPTSCQEMSRDIKSHCICIPFLHRSKRAIRGEYIRQRPVTFPGKSVFQCGKMLWAIEFPTIQHLVARCCKFPPYRLELGQKGGKMDIIVLPINERHSTTAKNIDTCEIRTHAPDYIRIQSVAQTDLACCPASLKSLERTTTLFFGCSDSRIPEEIHRGLSYEDICEELSVRVLINDYEFFGIQWLTGRSDCHEPLAVSELISLLEKWNGHQMSVETHAQVLSSAKTSIIVGFVASRLFGQCPFAADNVYLESGLLNKQCVQFQLVVASSS
ncbi:hypothetical protein KC361_g55 [Hortaea werneckii]|nr:hypothetical protein KC361_g55 [Hortaea werneckii]